MTERKKISGRIQLAILVFFIVFMPLGSWYYLQSGFNYHTKLMADLKDYGKIPAFELHTQNGDLMKTTDLSGKFTVLNYYSGNHPADSLSVEFAQKILEQFKNQDALLFLFCKSDSISRNDSVVESEGLKDERIVFLSGNEEQISSLFKNVPVAKNEDGSISLKPPAGRLPDESSYFVLADTSLTIRNYYFINDIKSINRLVEHLAIILPREKKSKAVYIPQKEK